MLCGEPTEAYTATVEGTGVPVHVVWKAGASDAWGDGDRAPASLLDGDSETTAVAEADVAWVELVFEDETTVAGPRILGKNKYGALGAGLQVKEGAAWRTVAGWRHCRS